MDARNNIATDLFYKIRSRFSGLKLGAETGAITINPEEARFFDFDYMEGDQAIGHVSISLAEANSMKVYFSSGITESMDDGQKDKWYGFLKELRQFAKRRLISFDTRDIAKDALDKRDFLFLSQANKSQQMNTAQPVGESVMSESAMYGSKTMSYQKLMDTRLIIKHNQAVMDDTQPGARTRHISALFVENQDGERFKYPFIHLAGARAMQRHVANGGVPYDDLGKSIVKMSEEIAQLKSFGNYVVRNDLMNSDTNGIVERSSNYLNGIREQLKALSKQRPYEAYKESFQAQSPMEIPQDVVEEFTDKFTVRNFKEDIKGVFPVLYRLMQEANTVGYDDIVAMTQEEIANEDVEIVAFEDPFSRFEDWAMGLGEDSAISSQDPEEQAEAIKNLQDLVGQHFQAGVDGSNAISSLKGIIEDSQLFQDIKSAASQDPDTDVRSIVKDWLDANAPEVVEGLDFGDMVDDSETPATDQGGEETAPEEVPQESSDEGEEGSSQKMNVQELAEFIHSFYDRDSGTFPKGPEGVCTMVGKKFGEQAEQVARAMVERMAPQQQAPELQELSRIRELAGTDRSVEAASMPAGQYLSIPADQNKLSLGQQMARDGFTYSGDNEREMIGQIAKYMRDRGDSPRTIRYYMNDDDFIGDTLMDLRAASIAGTDRSMEAASMPGDQYLSIPADQNKLSLGQQMARDGITYSRDNEREIIGQIAKYMKDRGDSSRTIRYYMNDDDFIGDTLSDLKDASSQKPDYKSKMQDKFGGSADDLTKGLKIRDDITPELEDIKRLSGISQGMGF